MACLVDPCSVTGGKSPISKKKKKGVGVEKRKKNNVWQTLSFFLSFFKERVRFSRPSSLRSTSIIAMRRAASACLSASTRRLVAQNEPMMMAQSSIVAADSFPFRFSSLLALRAASNAAASSSSSSATASVTVPSYGEEEENGRE